MRLWSIRGNCVWYCNVKLARLRYLITRHLLLLIITIIIISCHQKLYASREHESVFVVCQLLLRKLGMNLCEFWDDRSWDKEQSVRFYGNPGIFFRRHLQYHQTLSTFTRWHYQSLALRSYAVLVLSICWWVVQYRELTKFHNFCLMHQCSSSFQ